ncbi:MAG: NAD-dependent epimerase/dehydratase family protein [Acidobacteria bacterium]|nr:NAD-dependent epimerase/dehydratase family protein [Acidobacteriota bacterium]
MQILVFGGTRFIGRAIVARLLREGHKVTLVNRGVSEDPFATRVSRIIGDRREPGTITRAAARREYDAVVDVTAYHETQTAAVLKAFKDRVEHFIHISTAAVYLIREGLLPPFREQDFHGRLRPKQPGRESSWLYAYHKRRCEETLLRAWEEERFPFTSLRIPMVTGPYDYTQRADAYLERIASGGPVLLPEGGLNSWGFLWVEDIAETVVSNLANSVAFGRAYNLAQREALSLRQFVELAAGFLGTKSRFLGVPSSWLDAVGLGTGFSPYTHHHDILLDCRAAEDDLLFRPTPAVRWIEQLVHDFRRRWNGAVQAFGSTRPFELVLARELAKLRLPTFNAVPVSAP